jgi:hypothetical protein
VLTDGGFHALDRVEVAVLAHERGADCGDEAARIPAGAQEGGDELPRHGDLLLAVEHTREVFQEFVRVGAGVGRR